MGTTRKQGSSTGRRIIARATPPSPEPRLYRSRDVVQILDVSRRQLQYWAQTDLVVPSFETAGGHHRYTFEDLVALKAAKRLIDAGVSVQRIRSSIRALGRALPGIRRPLSELTLVATGDIVLVIHEGAVFEAIEGQSWIFDVAAFEAELDARRPRMRARPVRRTPRARKDTGHARSA